jgi:hypothetical protein
VTFSLDFATNAGTFPGTQAQLASVIRQVYKGGIGPYSKFYDGNQGIRAALNNLMNSGWGHAPGEVSPYVCYRPQASDDDLRFAFDWLVNQFPGQIIRLAHDQEPENKQLTAAQYIAKTDQEFRVRAEHPQWQAQIQLWPCLMGYQESTVTNPALNWRTLVQPSVDKIDGMSWDVYAMTGDSPDLVFADRIAPMLAAAKILGKPCALGEWGICLSTRLDKAGQADTEQRRAVRVQAAVDYMNAYAYDPVTRPWGIQSAAWWENYQGIVGNNAAAATGLTAAAAAGTPSPVLGVLLKAMGR